MECFNKYYTILKIKRYSLNTIKTYIGLLNQFAKFFNYSEKNIVNLSDKDVLKSVIKIVQEKKYSVSTQKQLIGSLKLFYKEMYRRDIDFLIVYPTRKSYFLPDILSKKEVKQVLFVIENLKHKAIIATIYGLGIRISEVIKLKIEDIDSDRMLVCIKDSKGNRDRYVMLPDRLLILLREYFIKYRPKTHLFEGNKGGFYSDTSIRVILKKAINKVGINKKITVHSLRHSFATHLLENGTDISVIQKLLGHQSIKTTLIYTKISKTTISEITSPLDLI